MDRRASYNERLFIRKGLRSRLHLSRYYWIRDQILTRCPDAESILELGCYDGKLLDFIETKPMLYEGFDANWEAGLDLARQRWNEENYKFITCKKPADFVPSQMHDITVCMETAEHLPTSDLESYVQIMRQWTKEYCFVTVPNEKGIIFLTKYIIKKIKGEKGPDLDYTLTELLLTVTGNLSQVARVEGGHKGFDYKNLLLLLERYFRVVSVDAIPFGKLPRSLSFTIGIVLAPKII